MKKILFLIIAILFSINSYAQTAMTTKEAEEKGIGISYLDSFYYDGGHADTSKAVFGANINEFVQAYYQLIRDIGAFLKENNFVFNEPTSGWHRIYFDKSGKIDYYLYLFKDDQLSDEQKAVFAQLINEFIKDYSFPLSADVNFAQCGSVRYMPPKEE